MGAVKLPFEVNPMLKTYHNLAHPLGIVCGILKNKEQWFPWLCNKYINCHFTAEPEYKFDVFAPSKFYVDDKIFHFIDLWISNPIWKKMIYVSEEEFTDTVRSMITKGAYIWGRYNERYVSAKRAYQRYDFIHDYLIYGYDDVEGGFYSVGYTKNECYEEFVIPYGEFYDSIFQHGENESQIRLVCFNPDCKMKLNVQMITEELTHYLNSTSSRRLAIKNTTYGIDASYGMLEYLKASEYLSVRAIRMYMEHKNLMLERLCYLGGVGIIDKSLGEEYRIQKDKAEKAYLLALKYNISMQQKTKEQFLNCIYDTIQADKIILPKVVTQLATRNDAN